jgi:phage tail-like protein
MAQGQRIDPHRNNQFHLCIDGIDAGAFREATVSDATSDPIEYRAGNDKTHTVRKIPGLIKYGNLVLKWGVTTDSKKLYDDWRKKVEDGRDYRKSVTVELWNEQYETVASWHFTNAWPTKYHAPDLNAAANEIAIETLEIAHEGMERTK